MQTSAAGNKPPSPPSPGFTLLELLVVVALIALATAGVSLSLRDSADSALERDAERLAVLLETARAQARASHIAVVWRGRDSDFVFEGLPQPGLPHQWLSDTTRVVPGSAITLGPEPLIQPQRLAVSSSTHPERRLWLVTDGLKPFKVQRTAELGAP